MGRIEKSIMLPKNIRNKVKTIVRRYCEDQKIPLTESLIEKKTEEMIEIIETEVQVIIKRKGAGEMEMTEV